MAQFIDKERLGKPGLPAGLPRHIDAGPAYFARLDTGMDFAGDRFSAC